MKATATILCTALPGLTIVQCRVLGSNLAGLLSRVPKLEYLESGHFVSPSGSSTHRMGPLAGVKETRRFLEPSAL